MLGFGRVLATWLQAPHNLRRILLELNDNLQAIIVNLGYQKFSHILESHFLVDFEQTAFF